MKKTLFVGLDAACWEYLNPLLRAGRLPTLQRLMDTGVCGTLYSTMPAHTPTAWASISSGKNPGKHGIYDHLWRRPGTYEFIPTNARLCMGTPFWKRLNDYGLRVGLVNVPHTYPPDPVDGFVVGGFGAPQSALNITSPINILSSIEKRHGSYEPVVDPMVLKTASPLEILEAEGKHQSYQVQIAGELAEQYQVQVLVINLMFLDHINHKLADMNQVEFAICQSDADIERLIQMFQPDNIMLFSDHGSRRVTGTFLLHAWLRDHGYCIQTKRSPSEYSDALNWLFVQWLQTRQGMPEGKGKLYRRVGRELVPKLPTPIADRFWKKLEGSIPFAREYAIFSEQMDYERTLVYPGASYSGLLYFNMKERDPIGVVSSKDQPDLVNELVDKLINISDPETGQPLISHVYQPKDLYEGRAVEYGPDLILDTTKASCNVLTNFRRGSVVEERQGPYFVLDQNEFGRHTHEGIFIFSGSDFKDRTTFDSGNVMDLPATLLYLYGVPIPEDYDGHSLTELITPEFVCQNQVSYQSGDAEVSEPFSDLLSSQETDELLSHLQSLGYIE